MHHEDRGGPHAGAPVPAQEDGLALRHRAQLRALSENSCSSQLGSDLHSHGYALSDSLSLPAILATGEDPSWLDACFFLHLLRSACGHLG